MGKKRFWIGMSVYAVIFAVIAGVGLRYLWLFLESFEASRTETAVENYVNALTTEDIILGSETLLAGLDGNLQSREDAEQVIRDSLSGDFHCARKGADGYVLLDREIVIGEFFLTPGEEDSFGFTPWQISGERFDLSYLLGLKIDVTVPETYQVLVNGFALDDSYVIQSIVEYPILEDFYGEYEMPYMVLYGAENFLGEADVVVLDEKGSPVTDLTDPSAFLDACTDAEKADVKKAMEVFLGRYVTFTGCANDKASENYYQLKKSLVKDSELAKRLYTAIDGLTYAQSYSDEIQSVEYGAVLKLAEGRYLCEATYFVRTSGRGGVFTTENRVKVVLTQTEDGLKVEAMTRV